MSQFDWWQIKLRRGAIRIALRRPMPESLTYGDRRNNNYQIRLGDQNDAFRFIPKVIVDQGVEGWYFTGMRKVPTHAYPMGS
ncbi:hypothetical protein CIT31_14355 [Mesorhizobium wenxiniae]|uniref:Uncharacterized protein n=1 Tax=Mesorhizobium wenxiniae TaxID=2014805 RepID=A0A271KHD7_9HYPH|nr:hypothetical protein CIT31_14355 [Mesorhizobium wenxiniae]